MADESPAPARIVSLDQFRGYTVLGMFLVNFVGSYAAVKAVAPVLSHHHTYFSYADSIMPQFFFAVGFAYRLTYLRRRDTDGVRAARSRVVRRCLGLMLLGFVVYHLDVRVRTWEELTNLGPAGFVETAFQRSYFQTLVHIAVTSLAVLPVIGAGAGVRLAFMAGCALLFLGLSQAGYYEWVMRRPGIDGGPLGFLTWTIPLLTGSLAYDVMATRPARAAAGRLLLLGALIMLLGYALACLNRLTPPNEVSAGAGWAAVLVEPPFFPPSEPVNIWTMSQRAGSVSYLTFGAGFAAAVYALFVLACDVGNFRWGLFRTLGSNALAAYIIHGLVDEALSPFTPRDAPLWYVAAMFGVFLWISYAFVRYLEKNRIFFRL